MKNVLLLAAAFAFTTSAAFAQTGNPSNMPSAGDPSTNQQRVDSKRMDNMNNTSTDRSDKKMMRKNGKMKSSDGSMKTKTKM